MSLSLMVDSKQVTWGDNKKRFFLSFIDRWIFIHCINLNFLFYFVVRIAEMFTQWKIKVVWLIKTRFFFLPFLFEKYSFYLHISKRVLLKFLIHIHIWYKAIFLLDKMLFSSRGQIFKEQIGQSLTALKMISFEIN